MPYHYPIPYSQTEIERAEATATTIRQDIARRPTRQNQDRLSAQLQRIAQMRENRRRYDALDPRDKRRANSR